MSVNPIDNNTTPKNTGSLEELFRHHLGEEAAVPPRPMLWDQIDNSLLIRQNETYRRRLVATRWVAAASLLLATLAGTGWWANRADLLGSAEMAANNQPAAAGTQLGRANNSTTPGLKVGAGQSDAALAANSPAAGTSGATLSGKGSLNNGTPTTIYSNATPSADKGFAATNRTDLASASPKKYTGFGSNSAARYSAGKFSVNEPTSQNGLASEGRTATVAAIAARETPASATHSAAAQVRSEEPAAHQASGRMLAAADVAGAAAAGTSAAFGGGTAGALSSGAAATTSLAATATSAATIAPEEVSLLAARETSLSLANATTLPNGLATVQVENLPATDANRWHYGASYTAGVFNPNVNFSRAGIEPAFDYDRGPAFGTDSPALTEVAATEYRNNLRPGLSQRIALLATRHLRGHWSLSTGAEFTQATAQSASSSSFVGEQLFDLGQARTNRPLHTTDFRYSMGSIPLEVRYSNPAKRGWSLYGRLGGVVTALLGVRSDVQGDPEATRTYSIASTGGPYRRVMGSLRGAAGTQFRTSTGKWALTVGPTAEIGLVALNAHPVQSYFAQSHPYSFGLEAGVEFGR
ncbi:hypothetical protein ACVWYF_004189 [Hymenobacter sp. UYAg731]